MKNKLDGPGKISPACKAAAKKKFKILKKQKHYSQ